MSIERTPDELHDFFVLLAKTEYKDNRWRDKSIMLMEVIRELFSEKFGTSKKCYQSQMVRDAISIDALINAAIDENLTESTRITITDYLSTLDAFTLRNGLQQHANTVEQHLYIAMSLTTALNQMDLEIAH